jgi:hypothetical protein
VAAVERSASSIEASVDVDDLVREFGADLVLGVRCVSDQS